MADERDSRVSQRYRELGSEEPPRELDQSILAAARRANDRAGRHRWYYVFGAAAIMVLAVAVTVQIERQRPDPELVAEATAPQARTDDSALKAPSKPVAPPEAESGLARDARPETPEQARSPAAPTESRSKEKTLGAAASRQEQTAEAQKPEARADSAPRPMAAPAARARMTEQAPESPERWLERIVQLRKEGRSEEAEKQLAEFRKRYPDYKVPESALK
jgi:hypothetical protein